MKLNFLMEKKVLTPSSLFCYKQCSLDGAVAQLGERLNGIQEVRGSIPRSSTIKITRHPFKRLPFLT
jgi:hypothetical protein